MIIDVCGGGAIGKGILRNWQRSGEGEDRKEGGWGGEMATGRGRLGGGKGDREMGRRAMVRGETWKGRGEGATGRGEGARRGDFTDGYDGWTYVIGLSNSSKQIECLGRQGLWHSLVATSTRNAWVE